ncbi:MAG: alpha/beta fold hydrolase [Moraxellaceae bacterium]|nr:MAG: alpha/beta fold hydrolase [Moraxellaceae bacterium]
MIALHGWLDNSASFFAIAPQLKNARIVAIDMAGHGRSDHRQGNAPYNIWEDVAEIFAIADQLGWQKFGLLGHSRGGIIAAIVAGTFAERVTHLGLIEGLLPEPAYAADAPKQLALSITGIKTQTSKPMSLYSDMASAISSRERGMFPLSHRAAKVLTERGVKKVEKGFQWSTDQRLLAPSAVKFSPEQIAAFLGRITAPVQLVCGDDGILKQFSVYKTELDKYPHIPVVSLPGGHHLHMEEQADDVASIFNTFFHE